MTTTPAEVSLTSRSSAIVQRVFAGVTLAAVVAAMVVLGFSGEPWWAITLWELGLLVTVFLMLALWSSAGESAKGTTALLAGGTKVLGEVTEKGVTDDGEATFYEIRLRIPVAGDGFHAWHRCPRCSDLEIGNRIHVLVDPDARTWAVAH
ncbi:hypothetical protein ABZ345_02030 [Lentzea sp. NPDC005914]|uniref:hypothetical protein n=1 Tax=Lentzea sp. NPDC005914 TaxID=3154572 RepID=UPI0033D90369